MISGLVLIGMVAAMAPILALMGGGDGAATDDVDDAPDTSDDDVGAGDLLDDLGEGSKTDHQIGGRQPADYEYVLGAGDHAIDDFITGEDTLILTSPTWDFELAETEGPDGGVALEITFDRAISTIEFTRLETLPVDDVFIWILEGDADPVLVPLSDALTEVVDGPGQALMPTDPDAPDELPVPIDGANPVAPGDPNAPDSTPADPSARTPLAPTDPDAPDP